MITLLIQPALTRLQGMGMSKYTTEVRFICEHYAGLDESEGFTEVNNIIAKSWNKIFTTNVQFFDENYKSVICQKILKHFYTREICCETVGLWKLWMNERLEMIMPYYNQLYESQKIKIEPLQDVNLTRKHNTTGTQNDIGNSNTNIKTGNNANSTDTINDNTVSTGNSTKKDLYSDTPQGAITGVENEKYLTNARKTTDNTNGNVNETRTDKSVSESSGTQEQTSNTSGTTNTTEEYLETLTGKQGGKSFSEMLEEYRKTFLNIDLRVCNEFNDLFINLW